MTITDQKKYDNRMKWIEYLKRPETKKHLGSLEDIENPDCRCCLGHACHVLAPDTRTVNVLDKQVFYDAHSASIPDELVLALGLHSDLGGTANIWGNIPQCPESASRNLFSGLKRQHRNHPSRNRRIPRKRNHGW